jgi:hypothetical protein
MIGFLALALVLGLAGCGLPGGQPSQPLAQVKNCGSFSGNPIGTADAHASAAEQCFLKAFSACEPATLTFTQMGVDTGTVHTFSIKQPKSGCSVADAAQGYSANFGGRRGDVQHYACAGLQAQSNGSILVPSCGDEGDIILPTYSPISTQTASA